MSCIEEVSYYRDKKGNLLRSDQLEAPDLKVGDRFFDCAYGRWATLIRIREDFSAPFESLYNGCERFAPFVAYAMYADIGEIEKSRG